MDQEKQIDLPKELLVRARARARSLGLTLDEYVQSLVREDIEQEQQDSWRQPISDEVMDRWEQDVKEFDEQEKKHPQKAARSAEELVKLLDEEAAQLDRYEEH
jgi:hypothetical protein